MHAIAQALNSIDTYKAIVIFYWGIFAFCGAFLLYIPFIPVAVLQKIKNDSRPNSGQ